jgi:hypothetical protein
VTFTVKVLVHQKSSQETAVKVGGQVFRMRPNVKSLVIKSGDVVSTVWLPQVPNVPSYCLWTSAVRF